MLRAVLLAGSSWITGTPLAVLVAQAVSSGGDAPTPLTNLVYAALGSSPATLILAWVVNRLEKEKTELRGEVSKEREENRRLNELRTDSAKEMATLLERTASVLVEVKTGMDATLREHGRGGRS